jgi:hypothetical protein
MRIGATRSAHQSAPPNERGSVMVEYAVLLTVVAVGIAFATVALGVPLMSMYLSQRTWLLLPYP